MTASSQSSAGVALFLRDDDTPTSALVPIKLRGDVALKDLAEEYCISSVLECDATGCVPPRAVALDSALDVLRGGRYYIARRDMPRVGRSPRVTFRGKITVEEFETDHALAGERKQQEKENCDATPMPVATTAACAEALACSMSRKRRSRNEDSNEGNDNNNTDDIYNVIDANQYTFEPFVGDLYNDGHEAMIQLEDAKRLCENVESDEMEFAARHTLAEKILLEARQALIKLTSDNNAAEETGTTSG